MNVNIQISESDSIKYLQIIVDRHITWECQGKKNRENRGQLPKFKYLSDYISVNKMKIIYFSLIELLALKAGEE